MKLTGQQRSTTKNTVCHTPTTMSAMPKSRAGTGPPGLCSPAAARTAGGTKSKLTNRKYAPTPTAQESASPATPDLSGLKLLSGQRSHTSESWSIAVKMAPASASVAGNVVGAPLPGVARNTARMSGRSTIASPAMVSTTPPTTISAVSARPVQGLLSREPGQSFHQKPIIATPDTANPVIGPSTSSDLAV